jgi:hypothetical protein
MLFQGNLAVPVINTSGFNIPGIDMMQYQLLKLQQQKGHSVAQVPGNTGLITRYKPDTYF